MFMPLAVRIIHLVTHQLQVSSMINHPTIKQREHQKINYYAQVTHDHHAVFYLLVMETYGAIGEQFTSLSMV